MGIGATTTTTATIVSMTIGAGAVVSSVYEARSRERETVAEEIIVWS